MRVKMATYVPVAFLMSFLAIGGAQEEYQKTVEPIGEINVAAVVSVDEIRLEQNEMKMIAMKEAKEEEESYQYYKFTAYTAGYESTQKKKGDKDYGKTASGTYVKEGRTLACAKSIPFGTKVYVPYTDTTYVCEDRGGAIKDGKFDIYFDSLSEAKEWGVKKLKAKIIKE